MIYYASTHFPITGETLAAMQEKQLGRKTYTLERQFFSELADTVNNTYQTTAANGNAGSALATMNAVQAMEETCDYDRFLKAFCIGWIMLAAVKGTAAHDYSLAKGGN